VQGALFGFQLFQQAVGGIHGLLIADLTGEPAITCHRHIDLLALVTHAELRNW
jgi:hypothetical protein